MAATRIQACARCGNEVRSTDQRTCPHCLHELRIRHLGSPQALAHFQEDRKEHGTYVEPVRAKPKRGVAGALLFAGTLLVGVAGAILLGGLTTGGWVSLTGALGDAVIPLSMGAALVAVAIKTGRWA
ncbi:MAG: hypothetical protein R3185_00465 [Candidatus Thermoplasmatota archaeon]|nr:hypothetical protein [Candidatus Thermoplasmatota archaeon]